MDLRILELFSGIGGMHSAFVYSQLPGNVVAAVDINPVANTVYAYNYPNTPVMNNNIQSLTAQTIKKLKINTILMSPPCQPHTRVGHQRDVADNRSDALVAVCKLLPQCENLLYVLMENVKGFESSQAHEIFLKALREAGFDLREFILSPTQFGVPNTRHRYYCVAKKKPNSFSFGGDHIWEQMPTHLSNSTTTTDHVHKIEQLLEPDVKIPTEIYLPEKVLTKRCWLLDIVTLDAINTMCFTKAYTHYSEGTGSVYTPLNAFEMKAIFAQVKELQQNTDSSAESQLQRVQLLKSLRLRYFTPREVASLMSFPESFDFPTATTCRQKYRLLGNSINVRVVGELIKLFAT